VVRVSWYFLVMVVGFFVASLVPVHAGHFDVGVERFLYE
jgi:hypothetical protein